MADHELASARLEGFSLEELRALWAGMIRLSPAPGSLEARLRDEVGRESLLRSLGYGVAVA